jgi:hypothetical protein
MGLLARPLAVVDFELNTVTGRKEAGVEVPRLGNAAPSTGLGPVLSRVEGRTHRRAAAHRIPRPYLSRATCRPITSEPTGFPASSTGTATCSC